MKRQYKSGTNENVRFFTGTEVEKTPAFGMFTLFVTGLNDPSIIRQQIEKVKFPDIKHIFFGANHSYDPMSVNKSQLFDYCNEWDKMIEYFLKQDYLCTLDIPLNATEAFLDGVLVSYNNFIPQLRVPVPYIQQWNYNTMVKIDDKGFDQSNPGVWCHNLHSLMGRDKFTDWQKYTNDSIIDFDEE